MKRLQGLNIVQYQGDLERQLDPRDDIIMGSRGFILPGFMQLRQSAQALNQSERSCGGMAAKGMVQVSQHLKGVSVAPIASVISELESVLD